MQIKGRTRTWRLAIAAFAVVATLAGAGAAHAQLGDVGEDTLDTDTTPVAKESERWDWWAGAKYSGTPKPSDVPADSVTPFELDFFDVAFRDANTGLAGGAICRDPVPAGVSPEEGRAYTDTCERVPALYRYSVDEVEGASWSEVDLGESTERRGYIGAIAWIDSDTALAVGGDGCYPRREEPCPDGNTPPGDPAGMARAWLYDNGSVSELTNLPVQMRGLTALDASPRLSDCDSDGIETQWGCAVAGGLRQLWHFRDGAFVAGYSGDVGDGLAKPERADIFQFRVRDLRFVLRDGNGHPIDNPVIRAVAVTAGCCTPDPARAGPRVLVFDGQTWYVRQPTGDLANIADEFGAESKRTLAGGPIGAVWNTVEGTWESRVRSALEDKQESECPDPQFQTAGPPPAPCIYNFGWNMLLLGNLVFGDGFDEELGPWPIDLPDDLLPPPPEPAEVDALYQAPHRELERQTRPYGASAQIPDSYYALLQAAGSGGCCASFTLVASPGGPAPDNAAAGQGVSEPASHVFSAVVRREPPPDTANLLPVSTFGLALSVTQNTERLLTSARLNSADQTTIAPPGEDQPNLAAAGVVRPRPSRFEAVGVLRSSGRGIAFGPRERDPHRVNEWPSRDLNDFPEDTLPEDKEAHGCGTENTVPECDADAERFLDQQRSLRLFALDSYALNAIDVLDDPLDKGAGWAVGDHGAIQSLAGQTSAQAQAHEPDPPALGQRKQAPLPDTSPYDRFRKPLTAEPGTVPPLGASAELERFDSPRFVPSGDPLTQIAMSRDGSEGWGFSTAGVYYFDGLIWRPCSDIYSTPDPSCPDLGPLGAGRASVDALVRIPLEKDEDPSNDDEFEILAFASGGGEGRAVVYRDGRWSYDDGQLAKGMPSSGVTSAAFIAPDDGWATASDIYRFDGDGWTNCSGSTADLIRCADPERRLNIGREQKAGPLSPSGSGASQLRLAVAGERVYLFGARAIKTGPGSTTDGVDPVYPLILYRDPGGVWSGSADGSDGGLDPGFFAQGGAEEPLVPDKTGLNPTVDGLWGGFVARPANALTRIAAHELQSQLEAGSGEGRVYGLGVTETEGGETEGWAVGEFGGKGSDAKAVTLRLEDGHWRAWPRLDASDDYLNFVGPPLGALELTLLPAPVGAHDAFLTGGVPLTFNASRGRWEVFDLPFVTRRGHRPVSGTQWNGFVAAVAPDNHGGLWVSASNTLYHYADSAPKPVFHEATSPVRDGAVTASAAGGDGSFWLGTDSNVLYRYDREVGWDSVSIPGWNAGRVVTNPSEVADIAVGPDGRGIAVGEGGRIAEIDPGGAQLDEAAGTVCNLGAPQPPCGTGRDLAHAAIAPDGSALVGGDGLTSLLYRPAGGDFRHVEPPARQPASKITALALPTPDRAFMALSSGRLFRGERQSEGFRWQLELETGIRQVEIAASGHGYALAGGKVLERNEDGEWTTLETGYENRIQAIAALVGGASGLIAGGEDGLLLTLQGGRFRAAHQADPFSPLRGRKSTGSSIHHLAVIPGENEGQIEAWAIAQSARGESFEYDRQKPAHTLLRYTSDPSLDPAAGLQPLPDAPAARPGEFAFAAFGKQDCQKPAFDCFEQGGNRTHAVIARRVTDEIRARAPMFALHTGDSVDSPTPERTKGPPFGSAVQAPANRDLKVGSFIEHTADPLTDAGVPVFGAIGGQDLTTRHTEACLGPYGCAGDRGGYATFWGGFQLPSTGTGSNVEWRRATALAPAPWERAGGIEEGSLRFEPVEDFLSQETPEADITDPRTGKTLKAGVPYSVTAATGISNSPELRAEARRGGRTHYAFDVVDESQDGRKLARIVVVDTSMGSLAASDAQAEPKEPGGQLAWLERVLCVDGSPQDTDGDALDCTREPDQRAIVLSNRPTYTYAQIDPSKLAQDAALFESTLIRYDVDVLVTGHLGWNGLYYTCAPGLHYPAPGQAYPERAPKSLSECAAAAGGGEAPDLTGEATGAVSGTPAGALPVVVASGAGGVLADETGSASDGFWHGYSLVHLDMETGAVRVEQRPVFEWVAISGDERMLEPRQQMTLQGYGREVFGQETPVRHLEIDSPAVTHRYDLLLADPEDPRVPCEAADASCQSLATKLAGGSRSFDSAGAFGTGSAQDDSGGVSASAVAGGGENPCDPYLCLPERVAAVDSITGELKAGNGKYPDTFAIAMLSVGDHVATYPMVFKRSPSFVVNPALTLPSEPIQTANATANPSVPPPPSVPKPNIPQPNLPELPALPGIPPLSAAQPPEPQPPAPSSPPPPSQQPSPLDLTVSPQAIAIATPTAVIQPPTPPVNPAPPGGARREARQRQAAAQKSGADSPDEGQEKLDLADSPPGAHGISGMTRHEATRGDRTRPAPSFTPLARADQPSAWAQGLLYGGGLALMAAALALGWQGVRPTPRRRPPDVPAAAYARARRRF